MTARQPTRLEVGRGYVLAYCTACPPWRRLAADRPEALMLAADHVALVHDSNKVAADLREQARHADHSRRPPE